MIKDYARWPNEHIEWREFSEFESRWRPTPGIHTVFFDDDSHAPVDLYVNEFVSETFHDVQPIFFNAAISTRNGNPGPFFSGVRMCARNNIPLISISDPGVDNDIDLKISWYTGSRRDGFALNLFRILDVIQKVLGREFLFAGGSGGGFAALRAGSTFSGSSSVFAWNPQTDIFQYSEVFVKAYLKSQFGLSDSALTQQDWRESCRRTTDEFVETNLVDVSTLTTPRRLLYLQNSTDWHMKKHLAPLWSMVSSAPLSDGANIVDKNRVVFVGEYAPGHAPPSPNFIGSVLKQLMDRSKPVAGVMLATDLDTHSKGLSI